MGVIAVFAVSLAGAGAYAQDDSADSVLEGIIEIGALIPVTGPASDHGEDIRFTVSLAEDDFNMYLEENGIDWRLNVVMEDTATSPVIALEKLSALKAKDISAVVGTYSSAELSNVMAYARNNNMLLISYGSVAPSLALSGDKVFRFVPDDTKQALQLPGTLQKPELQTWFPYEERCLGQRADRRRKVRVYEYRGCDGCRDKVPSGGNRILH